jgi:hypothetical protein
VRTVRCLALTYRDPSCPTWYGLITVAFGVGIAAAGRLAYRVTADHPPSIWHIDSEAGHKVMLVGQWLGLALGAAFVIAGLALCFAAAP